MSIPDKKRIVLKILAVVAMALMIFMVLSFILVPNEGEDASCVLKLKEGESRIKLVNTTYGEYVIYQMILANNKDSSTHEIILEIANVTYLGNSMESHWDFDFIDADPASESKYTVISGTDKIVSLKVTFLGSSGGEKVRFTIKGIEDNQNDTHLSPYGGLDSDIEYLTVYSSVDYDPFWEPFSSGDWKEQTLPAIFSITLWNIGAKDDTLSISGWEVWQDVNGDGIINPAGGRSGEDIKNDHFNVTFTTGAGAPYELNHPLSLNSGDAEQIKVIVTPELDNERVPIDHYLIKVMVYSHGGDITYDNTLKAYMTDIELPDFFIVMLDISDDDVEEGETIEMEATIGINWNYSSQVSYAFYVDDKEIQGARGTITFSKTDTTKVVSALWKAKESSGSDYRTIKVKVDPDNAFREKNENNNEKSEDIKVTIKEEVSPLLIIVLVTIATIAIVGGGYWWFAIAKGGGDLKVAGIVVAPEYPGLGETAEVTVVIKNEGGTIKGEDKHNLMVSFYDEYDPIGNKIIDLSGENFEKGETREVSFEWKPTSAGPHTLNVAVDIDNEETDVNSKNVTIKEMDTDSSGGEEKTEVGEEE